MKRMQSRENLYKKRIYTKMFKAEVNIVSMPFVHSPLRNVDQEQAWNPNQFLRFKYIGCISLL